MIHLANLWGPQNTQDLKKLVNNTMRYFGPQVMSDILKGSQLSEKDLTRAILSQRQQFLESAIKPKSLKNTIQHNQAELDNIQTLDTTSARRLGRSVKRVSNKYFVCYKELKEEVIQRLGGSKNYNTINTNGFYNSVDETEFSNNNECSL